MFESSGAFVYVLIRESGPEPCCLYNFRRREIVLDLFRAREVFKSIPPTPKSILGHYGGVVES